MKTKERGQARLLDLWDFLGGGDLNLGRFFNDELATRVWSALG